MKVKITPSRLSGTITAPPSKSFAHRLLIGAAAANGESEIKNVALSEDILATTDCLNALGAEIKLENGNAKVKGFNGKPKARAALNARESGSTLRFLIPASLLDGGGKFIGTERLMARGVSLYENAFKYKGITFFKSQTSITVKGTLSGGKFVIPGDVSSQYVTGLLLALPLTKNGGEICILPPVESRDYINVTLAALNLFGIRVEKKSENVYTVLGGQNYRAGNYTVEGDWSNAAFLYALNVLGHDVFLTGLTENSAQGDRVCKKMLSEIAAGSAKFDLADCPDLAPVLFATAAAKHGGCFTGTARLKIKESDRAAAMKAELEKFGAAVTVSENAVTIDPKDFHPPNETLSSHNDHRIAMALAVLASVTGGVIDGAEAVAKSYPNFWSDMRALGAKIEILTENSRC